MDADYNPEEEGEGRVRRKRRHSRALQLDPVLERQALESRLKGELFRYREVEPNDFGLSAAEVGVVWVVINTAYCTFRSCVVIIRN